MIYSSIDLASKCENSFKNNCVFLVSTFFINFRKKCSFDLKLRTQLFEKPCLARDRTFLSLLDQILSADIFQKFPNFFGGENWHQSGYFDTLPSSLSLIKVALVALKMTIFLAFQSHARHGYSPVHKCSPKT